nr:MAG TPA: hypothetical protein [Caudoviricetes sp.]
MAYLYIINLKYNSHWTRFSETKRCFSFYSS